MNFNGNQAKQPLCDILEQRYLTGTNHGFSEQTSVAGHTNLQIVSMIPDNNISM